MSQMQPSFRCLDRMRSLAILHLHNRMVMARIDNPLFRNHRIGHIIYQCPSDTATATSINKAILRTGVKRIFAIYELRMEHYVALLRTALQVRQTIPVNQVFGTSNTASSSSCREVVGLGVVMTLYAEKAVNPAVFMAGKSHIIHIRSRCIQSGNATAFRSFGQSNRMIPKTEIIHAIGRLGHSKERLSIVALYTHHQHVFIAQLNCS